MPAALCRLLLWALTATALTGPAAQAAENAGRGNLFSAIVCAETPLGIAWARLRPLAQKRFPHLKLTQVADLHVTVVYVGPGWQPDSLDRLRPLALTGPSEPTVFQPEIVSLGAAQDVVAVELHAPTPAWGRAVESAKAELNRLGLKRPDRYDASFRPHLTLAQASHRPPDATETAELLAFRAWLQDEIARNPPPFTVTLGPDTPVRLLLAGLPRADGEPEYVALEDFLRAAPAK